jgi:hypothetical protein
MPSRSNALLATITVGVSLLTSAPLNASDALNYNNKSKLPALT